MTPQDLIVLGVTDFDLLGERPGRIGFFDVLGRLVPGGSETCQVRVCQSNEIFLIRRAMRAILRNLLTGQRPSPGSGLAFRDDLAPPMDKQREMLSARLAVKFRFGVDPGNAIDFGVMLSDLTEMAPGRVVAVRMPVSSDLVLGDRQKGVVAASREAMADVLANAGVPVLSTMTERPIAPGDFSDILHVWPDISTGLMQEALAPDLRPLLDARPGN